MSPAELLQLVRGKSYLSRERAIYRPTMRKSPQELMRTTASKAIAKLILLTPCSRSMKVIGTSAIDPPLASALRVISI
jgi:hypothetical protein